MTESEAIEQFKERLTITDYKEQIPEYYKAMELAIKALEKQIPKKAIITGHNNAINTDVGYCPICKGVILRACDNSYCPDCGQKLDWESDEE